MLKSAVLSFVAGIFLVFATAIAAAFLPARHTTRAIQMPTGEALQAYNASVENVESQIEIEN